MLKRLYVHNYRCLENFNLVFGNLSSILLIGANGSGKTTVSRALQVLQAIGSGTNRVATLVDLRDFPGGRTDVPMRFEIEVTLSGQTYVYSVAFDFPHGFRELRVADERLSVGGEVVFSRELAQVRLARMGHTTEAAFRIDWHLVALPIVQEQSPEDPLSVFRRWLANVLILRPVPSLADGSSDQETLQPNDNASNIGAWFSGVIATAPAAYTRISDYLMEVMPDFQEITNPTFGKDSRSLILHFQQDQRRMSLSFEDLSDGEKCFIIFAVAIAANSSYGPMLCFWDEPENFLAPSEVGHSIVALRQSFQAEGQLIVTSHSPEAIRRFSDENTLVFYRNSHLEPTQSRSVEDLRGKGDFKGGFIDALLRGDVGR